MHEVVKSDGNLRTVDFQESAERISKLFTKIRKQISRDLDMPGFRKGKVPRSIIDKQYGNLIKAEVADTVRQELTSNLLDEEDWILDDADPENKMDLPVEGKPYSFQMTFSLFETPVPEGTDGIEIQVPVLDLDKAVDDSIQSIREKMVNYEEVDRPSEEGDLVLLETEPPEGEDPQEFTVVIGQENIGKGFDSLVTGVEPGHRFSARMEGGEEDPRPVHSFIVRGIRKPVLPELNDEFAKKVTGTDTMEELREKVAENTKERFDQELDYLKERTAVDKLLQSNSFDPPEYMVKNLTGDYLRRLGEEDPGEDTVKAAGDLARDKVREFLILRAFAEKENIEVTGEEISEEQSPEESESSVRDRLRNRKAMELILERADIVDKKPDEEENDNTDQPESPWCWKLVEEDAGPDGEEEA